MSQENYMECVAFVRKQEGGNTETPGDRGGRTGRGGITHAVYDAYRASKGLPRQDVFAISDVEIADIYLARYWDPIHGGELRPGVDLCIFDYAINSGPRKANWARLQAIAGGAVTPASQITKICADRLSFMHALGSWSRFGGGWGRRVAACEALALRMAKAPLPGILDAAKAKASRAKKQAGGAIAAGAPAGGGAHSFVHHGLWVLAAIASIVILLAAAAAFNAWRHGQRADALGAAIKLMRDGEEAAIAARTAAEAAAGAKEKAIADEQAVLGAARGMIREFPSFGQKNRGAS